MTCRIKKIVLASHNAKKTEELRAILAPLGIELANLSSYPGAPKPVEDGDSFAANAVIKAESARDFAGTAAVADDSGLVVDALGGEPGVRSARYAGVEGDDSANNLLLLDNLATIPPGKRNAKFVSVIALAVPGDATKTFYGETHGVILTKGRGEGGFGYDPLFLSNDLGKTFAEASGEEKNLVSHRARAISLMIKELEAEGL